MPAFTFEKISPPEQPGPIAPAPETQRGVIVQIIGRLAETRAKRSQRKEAKAAGHQPKSSD